jgi:hypothetical protein
MHGGICIPFWKEEATIIINLFPNPQRVGAVAAGCHPILPGAIFPYDRYFKRCENIPLIPRINLP